MIITMTTRWKRAPRARFFHAQLPRCPWISKRSAQSIRFLNRYDIFLYRPSAYVLFMLSSRRIFDRLSDGRKFSTSFEKVATIRGLFVFLNRRMEEKILETRKDTCVTIINLFSKILERKFSVRKLGKVRYERGFRITAWSWFLFIVISEASVSRFSLFENFNRIRRHRYYAPRVISIRLRGIYGLR